MSKTKFYHVAGTNYEIGSPLLSWETCQRFGVDPGPWKWEDAWEGFDGHMVCLHRTLDDALDFANTYGGTVLSVDVPDEIIDGDIQQFHIGYGHITVKFIEENSEGYPAVTEGIPAEWINIAR